MSVDSVLDGALTLLLSKARQIPIDTVAPSVRPASIPFVFSGGGSALSVATSTPLLAEIPFPCTLLWVHLYAGDKNGLPVVVTATVDIQLTQFSQFGTTSALRGTGVAPAITLDSLASPDLTGWQTNLVTGDALIARLLTFSGAATWLACSLFVRPSGVPQGVAGVSDLAGTAIVDSLGNPVVLRS